MDPSFFLAAQHQLHSRSLTHSPVAASRPQDITDALLTES